MGESTFSGREGDVNVKMSARGHWSGNVGGSDCVGMLVQGRIWDVPAGSLAWGRWCVDIGFGVLAWGPQLWDVRLGMSAWGCHFGGFGMGMLVQGN